jgi:hypothetical protein
MWGVLTSVAAKINQLTAELGLEITDAVFLF